MSAPTCSAGSCTITAPCSMSLWVIPTSNRRPPSSSTCARAIPSPNAFRASVSRGRQRTRHTRTRPVVVHVKPEITGQQAIIVMGVAGSGKSTLGAALARALNCPFLEGDDFHAPEAVTRMRAGTPLTDDDRWPWLDRLGRAISAEVVSHGIVVAACSALRRAFRNRLQEVITARVGFVLLDADPEELLRRLTERKQHYMPPSLLAS